MTVNSKYFRTVIKHIITWSVAFALFVFLREFGQNVSNPFSDLTLVQRIRMHVALSLIAGVLFGSLEFFYELRVFRKMSFGRVVLLGSFSYLLVTIIFMVFGVHFLIRVSGIQEYKDNVSGLIFSQQGVVLIFYCFLVGFLIDLFKEIDKKFGPGNLFKMMIGEFYHPKETEKIIMFLDLKSSTEIAEKIGHLKYSQLIQDCFRDLVVAANFRAEVYQYVGDEAVLTWSKQEGLEGANCLMAFFAFEEKIRSREEKYLKKYGLIPEFKAGVNIGVITVAEVGEIKREIAYHGDTVNTAARIQSECNNYGKKLLVSEQLMSVIVLGNSLAMEFVDHVNLKGKRDSVPVYSVTYLE